MNEGLLKKLSEDYYQIYMNGDITPVIDGSTVAGDTSQKALNSLRERLGKKLYNIFTDDILELKYESERNGFINGFQYALTLATKGVSV